MFYLTRRDDCADRAIQHSCTYILSYICISRERSGILLERRREPKAKAKMRRIVAVDENTRALRVETKKKTNKKRPRRGSDALAKKSQGDEVNPRRARCTTILRALFPHTLTHTHAQNATRMVVPHSLLVARLCIHANHVHSEWRVCVCVYVYRVKYKSDYSNQAYILTHIYYKYCTCVPWG